MKKTELIFSNTATELTQTIGSTWLDEVATMSRAGKPHHVALSGGRIAKQLFLTIAEQSRTRKIPLNSVHFFWADERCVPSDDPESNFADAHKLLFQPLNISGKQIHRIRGEEPPDVAARKATEEICRIVPLNSDGHPVLDLILLGMGEDGHVASLFPGEPEAMITDKAIYRAVRNSPKPPPDRVTLGYSAIVAAKQVWVLASGKGKETALRESLGSKGDTPLARVLKLRGRTEIFSDISLK